MELALLTWILGNSFPSCYAIFRTENWIHVIDFTASVSLNAYLLTELFKAYLAMAEDSDSWFWQAMEYLSIHTFCAVYQV